MVLSALMLLACSTASVAQSEDALLPTHLIDGGQVFATGTLRYIGGEGDAEIGGVSGDFKRSFFQLQLDAGIGLGSGFEILGNINYEFIGKTKSEFSSANVEFESEDQGFSDLMVNLRYALLKDGAATPQLIIGGIVVAPVGNDKDGQTETKVGGTTTQELREGGLGLGVWRYGFEAGISKKLALVEPYLLTNYIFADKRKQDGVEEERADVWTLIGGVRWHLSPMTILDTRLIATREGKDIDEVNQIETEEEAHFAYTAQAALQIKLGSSATFLVLAGATFVEGHELNDVIQLELDDDLAWFAGVGLHLQFGGGEKK